MVMSPSREHDFMRISWTDTLTHFMPLISFDTPLKTSENQRLTIKTLEPCVKYV